jgi:hypothetical protein
LREKIEPDPAAPTRIQTVWGVGYRYEKLSERPEQFAERPGEQPDLAQTDRRAGA